MKTILPVTTAAVAACSALGSLASREVNSSWYAALDKPSFQPPGAVFGLAWTVLYGDIAVTSAVALDKLRRKDPAAAAACARALAVNLLLNTGWSWVFFGFHRLGAAVAVAVALAASSGDLVRRTASADRRGGVALGPYPLWCAFATALSAAIWRRNR